MNERLKELYQQAHSIRRYDGDPALDGNPPTVYWQGEVSAQRFAELLIRKCVSVLEQERFKLADDLDTEYDDGFVDGIGRAEYILKQHFR